MSSVGNIVSNIAAVNNLNYCRTPLGIPGQCSDIRRCIYLIFDLSLLRQSVCFRNLVLPGVCCPITQNHNSIPTSAVSNTISSTISSTTLSSISSTTPTFSPSLSSSLSTLNTSSLFQSTKKPIIISSTTTTTTTTIRPTYSRPHWGSHSSQKYPLTTIRPLKPSLIEYNNLSSIESSTNLISKLNCGESGRDGRIVGGQDARPGQWPWIAAIFLDSPKGREFWCGGALIDHNYILTAAHCLSDHKGNKYQSSQITVRLGEHHLYRDDDFSKPIEYKALEVKQHSKFQRHGFFNDIGLIKLKDKVIYSTDIHPICLPNIKEKIKDLVGYMATVIGWGTIQYGGPGSGILQQVSIPIWQNTDCDNRYFQPINQNFLCAGYVEGGKDACQGDSGSPLMIADQNRKWTIYGIGI
ncbi:proclotting enzyme-like [Oppia nitens]|uniref:proclotting enzyme-like n=1 Tax=Oppia nitens TaxID=1686743 RepID=UPI0023DAF3E3|nr:proclotting enzyme-like [Oppia nitens]